MQSGELLTGLDKGHELLVGGDTRNARQLLHQIVGVARSVILRMKDAVDIVKEIIFGDRFARICSLEVRQCLLREAARHLTRFAEVECVFCCLRLFAGKPTRKTLSVTIEVQISNVICHQGYLPSILCILIDADDQIVYPRRTNN